MKWREGPSPAPLRTDTKGRTGPLGPCDPPLSSHVHLFSTVGELLLWGSPSFLLHMLLDSLHFVCGLSVEVILLSSQRLQFLFF